MFSLRSHLFLLLYIFPFISSSFFSFSYGASPVPHGQSIPIPGITGEGVVTWGTGSFVGEGTNDEPLDNSSLILAANRTYRRDPINGFKRYSGGWNISELHYWTSVLFTSVPLLLIAAIWFVGFGLCLLLSCLCYCCCRRRKYGYSRTAYALSLIFLMLFTIAAIIGCIVLYTGQGKFHNSTTNTLEYVVKQADTTAENLKNVSDYLAAAKRIGVAQVFLPSNVQAKIDNVEMKINAAARTLSKQTETNSNDIQDVLDTVRLALIVIAAVMLLLAFLGFLFSVLGMQFHVYILVILGWILVAGTFILCGIFLLLHNVVADTCVAMDQWVRHPTAHSALDDILPCVDNATSQETLLRSKEVTFQLVNMVNSVITNVSNVNSSPNFPLSYYNQSGPLMPILCNPFYSNMTNRTCTAGEVDFNNATQVWRNYVCQVSAAGICTTVGRVTPTIYDEMTDVVNVSYGLYHYSPFLVELENCIFVRRTFSHIERDYCPGLQLYSKWIYIGLVMVSAAVMLSLIFWIFYARERRHRAYTKEFIARSAQGPVGEEPIEYEYRKFSSSL